jgi:hypothetical protein
MREGEALILFIARQACVGDRCPYLPLGPHGDKAPTLSVSWN